VNKLIGIRLTVTSNIFTWFFQISKLRLISSRDEEAIVRLLIDIDFELTPVLVLQCLEPCTVGPASVQIISLINFTRSKFGDDFKLPHAWVDMTRNRFGAQERVGYHTGQTPGAQTRDIISCHTVGKCYPGKGLPACWGECRAHRSHFPQSSLLLEGPHHQAQAAGTSPLFPKLGRDSAVLW